MKAPVCLAVLLTLVAGGPGARATEVRQYEIEARIDPAGSRLEGDVVVHFAGSSCPEGLPFYLHGELRVTEVSAGGKQLTFEQRQVFYDSDYSLVATRVDWECGAAGLEEGLEIHYAGHFSPSKARTPSDYMRIDAEGAFLRSYGYSLWFPVFLGPRDDSYRASFSRVVLRAPADFVTVFAGHRLRDEVIGRERVSEWSAPDLDLFDAQLTAARFVQKRGDRVWLFHRDRPESAATAEAMASLTDGLVEFFARNYRAAAEGSEVIHLVEMPPYGNIASGNVIGIATAEWADFDPGEATGRLLAHELVHSFVQPPIKRQDPAYALVVEGFPSYFHLPALAERLGEGWYRRYLDGVEERYLTQRETGLDRRGRPLPPEKPLLQISAEEIGTYKDRFVLADRALLFLDALRTRLGAERFLQLARRLLDRQSLTAAQLRETVLEAMPELERDLRLWLETSDYPERWRRP